LWSLYAGYLLLRNRIDSPQRRAIVSAVYGIVAFLDVPLLYLSAKLLPDVHPTGLGLTPAMYPTLWVWFLGMTMLSIGLIGMRFAIAIATLEPWDDEQQHPHQGFRTGAMR
jgi:heme exporter protein C